jgi:hypothetical protein
MGTDRPEKPKTTKNKEKRHQRDEEKRPGSDQPSTDGSFQSHKLSTMNHHQNAHSATQNLPLCTYILWTSTETEASERNRINITSEVWKGGKKEIEKLITYVKKIQLYNGICKEKEKRKFLKS